jgi:hypothetical protein
VGARRADRQHLFAAAYQHHGLTGGVPEEGAFPLKVAVCDPLGQIWSGELRLTTTHAA